MTNVVTSDQPILDLHQAQESFIPPAIGANPVGWLIKQKKKEYLRRLRIAPLTQRCCINAAATVRQFSDVGHITHRHIIHTESCAAAPKEM